MFVCNGAETLVFHSDIMDELIHEEDGVQKMDALRVDVSFEFGCISMICSWEKTYLGIFVIISCLCIRFPCTKHNVYFILLSVFVFLCVRLVTVD